MRTSTTTNRAFTLIELLTVIAIIGVLAALLFPAIKGALLKAERNKAQAAISGLATAFRSYYTEYGKWPVNNPEPSRVDVDATMVKLLQGKGTDPAVSLPPYQGNPRNIVFLEFKVQDLDSSGVFVDPWKQVYHCTFDTGYDNQIQDAFNTAKTLDTGFLIWSTGPDGQDNGTCGDPPGPYTEPPPCVNRDNVKSW